MSFNIEKSVVFSYCYVNFLKKSMLVCSFAQLNNFQVSVVHLYILQKFYLIIRLEFFIVEYAIGGRLKYFILAISEF